MMTPIDQEYYSKFFEMDGDKLFKAIALLKTVDETKDKKSAGLIRPMQGFIENYFQSYNTYGVRDKIPFVPDIMLREIERKNPIIGACVNLRCRQVRSFTTIQKDDNKPGFRIVFRNEEATPSKQEKAEMSAIEQFFLNTGLDNVKGWEAREDSLHDVFIMMVRDYLTIDKIAIELRKDRKGRIVDFFMLDAATIKKVAPGGYRGGEKDIDSRFIIFWSDEFYDKLRQAKIENMPPVDEIAFVQEINGDYVAAFRANEILFDMMQKRSDIRYRVTGYSPVEQAMTCVTGFLYALAYNAEAFNTGAIPKLGLSFEQGDFGQEEFERMQDQWIANYRGIKGSWRMPLFNGKVNVIDLMRSPRDMEYGKYLEITGALICSVMGVDPAEIGLRLAQAQNVLSENTDAKMKFSKDRGLHDTLGEIQSIMNKIMRYCGWHKKYAFQFTGIDPADAEQVDRLRTSSVKRDKTINELRAEQDMPPDPYGDIILDPTYMQYRMMKMQQEQEQAQGGDEEGGDMGMDMGEEQAQDGTQDGQDDQEAGQEGQEAQEPHEAAIDELSSEMADQQLNKAINKHRARTMLI